MHTNKRARRLSTDKTGEIDPRLLTPAQKEAAAHYAERRWKLRSQRDGRSELRLRFEDFKEKFAWQQSADPLKEVRLVGSRAVPRKPASESRKDANHHYALNSQ